MTEQKHLGRNPEHREAYDVVTARAVARMSVLSELCLPLVKMGGTFIAMKGSSGKEELHGGEKAISLLGGLLEELTLFLYLLRRVSEIFLSSRKGKQHQRSILVNQVHLTEALLSRVTFSY